MPKMTEEEAIAFSEFFINNKVTLGPNGSDWLSRREMLAWGIENQAVNFIMKKALKEHKPPALIINELVYKELYVRYHKWIFDFNY